MTSNVHNLGAQKRQRRRVFGLAIKAESKQMAVEIEQQLRALSDEMKASAKSEDNLYEFSVDRTTIMIWAETPDSASCLLEKLATPAAGGESADKVYDYRVSGRHVRYKTEPVLMEPVMWIDINIPGLYESNVMELISGLAGHITHQKEIASGRCRIRAEAPLSELYDFSTRISALCDSEASVDMGFSHYRNI